MRNLAYYKGAALLLRETARETEARETKLEFERAAEFAEGRVAEIEQRVLGGTKEWIACQSC